MVVPKDDSRPVESIINNAEYLVTAKAYAVGAEQFVIVTTKESTVGKYYLRRGERLERIDEVRATRKVYQSTLDKIPKDYPNHVELNPTPKY